MPIFMIERSYAEALELDPLELAEVREINDEESVRWIYSFLSADRRKTYCLYEATSPAAIQRAAARAGLPADVITEITAQVQPDGELRPV